MRPIQLLKPHPMLLYLSLLQIAGALRSLRSRVFTLPGLYLVLIAIAFFAPFFADKTGLAHWLAKIFITFGPLAIGFVFFYACRIGLSGTAFYFSPAETNFLLTAPVTKDDLLSYKFQQYHFAAFLVTFLASIHLSRTTAAFFLLFVELYLVVLFLILIPLAVGSIFGRGESALARVLRFLLTVVLTLLFFSIMAAILLRLSGQIELSDKAGLFFRKLITPFEVFCYYLLSADPARVRVGLIILGATNLVLIAVFALRSSHLEIESIFYKAILQHRASTQRLKGNLFTPLGTWLPRVPSFPYKQGLGPVLWCKAHEVGRRYPGLLFLFFLFSLGFASIVTFYLKSRGSLEADSPFLMLNILYIVECVVLFIMLFSGFSDFRADADKIEILKSLPITPARIVAGYLALPLVVVTLFIQCLAIIGYTLVHQFFPAYPWILSILCTLTLAPLIAFLFLSSLNVCFLLFPVQSEVKGKLIGSALLQFLAQVTLTFLVAWGLGQVQTLILNQWIEQANPIAWFTMVHSIVLALTGSAFFCCAFLRFKTFNVTRLSG